MKRIISLTLLLAIFLAFTLLNLTSCSRNNEPDESILILETCDEATMHMLLAIHQETGYNPIIDASNYEDHEVVEEGHTVIKRVYTNVKVDPSYLSIMRLYYLSTEEFLFIQEWQKENNIQVFYPLVDQDLVFETISEEQRPSKINDNVWYKCSRADYTPMLDENGNYISAYNTTAKASNPSYDSLRIEGDKGDYIYGTNAAGGVVKARIFFNNYLIYRTSTNTDSQ